MKDISKKVFKAVFEKIVLPIQKFLVLKFQKKLPVSRVYKRIMVVKFGNSGDQILALPALKALREKFRKAEIILLCNNTDAAELLASSYVDGFESFNMYGQNMNFREIFSFTFASELYKLWRKSWARKCGLLIDLSHLQDSHVQFIHMLLGYLSRAKYRIGLDTAGRGFFYHAKVFDDYPGPTHEIDHYLKVAALIGAKSAGRLPEFLIREEEQILVEQLFSSFSISNQDLAICLHLSSSRLATKWPTRYYAELSNKLIRSFKVKILAVGTNEDKNSMGEISGFITEPTGAKIDEAFFKKLIAIIKRCRLFIGNDSALMHIAVGLEIPTIGIIGPSTPSYYLYNLNHFHYLKRPEACKFTSDNRRGCPYRDCKNPKCIEAVSVDDVYSLASNILNEVTNRIN